jgi:predicted nuclease of predicted toxin-antitoxin system
VKLLFDQNISFRIISKIINNFPEAKQVRQLGIENDLDIDIWYFAKKYDYTIVTYDSDFYDLSNLKVILQKSYGYELAIPLQIF